ncbi:MAG TPA: hypothetical protein VMW01_07850 [Williamwhitmania sp.]|nr:hypothetical protein [Williamwhitmania sp.]
MKKVSFILGLLLFTGVIGKQATAQQAAKHPLFMVAYSDSTQHLLRWAPTTTIAWMTGIKYGYMVERVTIARNGEILEKQEHRLLTPTPLLPLKLEQFEPIADTSDMAAVAAQAIYGDDAKVDPTVDYSFIDLINKARAQEDQRNVGLLVADRSFAVAKMMGLGFEDTTMRKGEDYVYKVYFPTAIDSTLTDTAFAYIGAKRPTELPRPFLVKAEAQQKRNILVSWPTEVFYGIYSFYRIERSLDGGHKFNSLTKDPYMSVNQVDKGMTYYLDSLPAGANAAWYRVIGLTPFGIAGPPSDTVAAILQYEQRPIPQIDSMAFTGDTTLYVQWSVPAKSDSLGGKYSIIATRTLKGQYKTLARNIPAGTRSATVGVQNEYLLYVNVVFKDNAGKEYLSLPRICQRPDSIPPAPPIGLVGSVDSVGVAHLHWLPNTEADLLGYRVYYSFDPSAEFIQATDSLCVSNHFSYQTPQRVLNRRVYFMVLALDRRFNRSGFSKVASLLKEDCIPPSPPIMDIVSQHGDSLTLRLIPSSSGDVASHELRTQSLDGKLNIGLVLKVYKNQPVDTLLQLMAPSGRNRLTLVAIDSSGNRTASIPVTVTGTTKVKGKEKGIVDYTIDSGVLIFTLDKKAPEVKYAIIYLKNQETGNKQMVARLSPMQFPYTYGRLPINSKLQFAISIVLENNKVQVEQKLIEF